ncbi:hypothetical protein N566_07945, partial [Streptomycetaceae bacterium MP113-05]
MAHPQSPLEPVRAETIRTPRLTLLPLRVEHAAEMAEVLDDPTLHTFVGGSPEPADALRHRYRRLVAGSPDPAVSWCNWVVRDRVSGRLTGYVQVTVVPAEDGDGRSAEIAWVVGTPWQGRGIAKEAARALADWLHDRPVVAITAHVHPGHAASAAVAAAAGL